jgi:hypothetical protein
MTHNVFLVARSQPIFYLADQDGRIIGDRRLSELAIIHTHGRKKLPDVVLHSTCGRGIHCFMKVVQRTLIARALRHVRHDRSNALELTLDDGDVLSVHSFGGRRSTAQHAA